MTLNSLINSFLEYSEVEKGHSILTVRNYHQYLLKFVKFAKEANVEEPGKIDLELVRKYRLWLNRQPGANKENLSKATANYYLIALRTFLKYLGSRNIDSLSPEKIELAKTDERQITFLKDEELDEILEKPNLKTIQGLRDKAILELLFSTGLRVSELCNLKKEDINLEKQEFSVKGKGGKVRVVFIDENARESLKQYLSTRRDKSDFLFVSYGHTNKTLTDYGLPTTAKKTAVDSSLSAVSKAGITPRSIQRMIKKYSLAAGITKDVTPHVLRHSFATDLLMGGADLRSVQALLGHSSVTTTQIYTHVTDKHLGEVHKAFHGKRRNIKELDQKES
ncbi:MAG: Integrase-recombinase [Berkelbacteria bacterium GW2011_GWA1_39_10]|uniref:Integrase-recombinase n=1 Tax=Berkelbacteria bacterium GW2011_GWA1_39_10 TaxID=1618332 RepID=A0A0G0LEQ1_9BACT|nr:MAG: Integrase-recombinase [Berkelbacteria bacterium GW2011_GWA1_39_10]